MQVPENPLRLSFHVSERFEDEHDSLHEFVAIKAADGGEQASYVVIGMNFAGGTAMKRYRVRSDKTRIVVRFFATALVVMCLPTFCCPCFSYLVYLLLLFVVVVDDEATDQMCIGIFGTIKHQHLVFDTAVDRRLLGRNRSPSLQWP